MFFIKKNRGIMGNQKLVWCCIAGIVLGYLAPFFITVNRGTSLSIGMIAGLGIGYLLEVLDDRKNKEEQQEDNAALNQKAQKANKLLEQARAEVSGSKNTSKKDRKKKSAEEKTEIAEPTLEEQSEKLSEAETLLRQAREQLKK